jgi:VanZ family protein
MTIPASQSTRFRARTFWLSYWGPALVWLGVIATFSTRAFGARNTGTILRWLLNLLHIQLSQPTFDTLHFFWRKGAHCFAYGVLSLVLFRALRGTDTERAEWKPRYLGVSLVVCLLTAIIDETHQYYTTSRSGNPNDVVLDLVAATFVQIVILLWIQVRTGRANSNINPDNVARPAER